MMMMMMMMIQNYILYLHDAYAKNIINRVICLHLQLPGIWKRNGGGGHDDIIFAFQKTRIPYNLTPIIGKRSVFMSLF